jgi:hypothetical protein
MGRRMGCHDGRMGLTTGQQRGGLALTFHIVPVVNSPHACLQVAGGSLLDTVVFQKESKFLSSTQFFGSKMSTTRGSSERAISPLSRSINTSPSPSRGSSWPRIVTCTLSLELWASGALREHERKGGWWCNQLR